MAVTLPSAMATQTKNLLASIAQILGVDLTLTDSRFVFKLECRDPDGQHVFYSMVPGAGGATQGEVIKKASNFVVPATEGTLDTDSTSGTATMVASTIDVTVTGGVPVGSSVYATVTTPGGKTKELAAVRKNATEITISSPGSGYGALLASTGVSGALVAGVKSDFALANVAGDVLAVRETVAGGAAADHFSVVRVNDTTVKAQAHDAAGALVAGNTSTVQVLNFGQAAHETSLVRWIVVRP